MSVEGSGFRVMVQVFWFQGAGFRDWGLWFMAYGEGVGCRVQIVVFRFDGLGFMVDAVWWLVHGLWYMFMEMVQVKGLQFNI